MVDVGRVGIDLEPLVDNGVWCVDVDLSCPDSSASRACSRVSCLSAHVAHRSVHVGVDKLCVVLVHDFLVDQCRVFCLLDEEFLEQEQLDAQEGCKENGGSESDGRTRIGGTGG